MSPFDIQTFYFPLIDPSGQGIPEEEAISETQLEKLIEGYEMTGEYSSWSSGFYSNSKGDPYANTIHSIVKKLYKVQSGDYLQSENCSISNFRFNGQFGDLTMEDADRLGFSFDWNFIDEKTGEQKQLTIVLYSTSISMSSSLPDFTKGGPLALWSSNRIDGYTAKSESGQKLKIKFKIWPTVAKKNRKKFLYAISLKDGDEKLGCKSTIK